MAILLEVRGSIWEPSRLEVIPAHDPTQLSRVRDRLFTDQYGGGTDGKKPDLAFGGCQIGNPDSSL